MRSAFESNIWKFYVYKFARGLFIPATIWTLYLLARGFDFSQIGIIDIVFAATILLLEIPSGAFVDLVGRKWSVFIGYTFIGAACILIGLTGKYHLILLFTIIDAVGDTLFSGADNALLYDSLKSMKKESRYTKVDGKGHALFSLGSVCGGFIGAYLFTVNISYPFYLGGLIFFLAGVVFLFMKEPVKCKTKYSIQEHYKMIIDGIKYVKGHRQVKWIIAYCSLIAAMFGYQVFIVQPSLTTIGFDVKYFGFLFALIWGFEALVTWKAHKVVERLGEKQALFLITFIHIVCFVILSKINIWAGLIFIIINYFGRGLFYPITNNYIHKHIVSNHRATTLSVQNTAVCLLGIISTFIFSRLTDLLSINKVYLIVGVTTAIAAIILYFTYPKQAE